jgi:hypothetical protein
MYTGNLLYHKTEQYTLSVLARPVHNAVGLPCYLGLVGRSRLVHLYGWHLDRYWFGGTCCNVCLRAFGFDLVLSGQVFRLVLGLKTVLLYQCNEASFAFSRKKKYPTSFGMN